MAPEQRNKNGHGYLVFLFRVSKLLDENLFSGGFFNTTSGLIDETYYSASE